MITQYEHNKLKEKIIELEQTIQDKDLLLKSELEMNQFLKTHIESLKITLETIAQINKSFARGNIFAFELLIRFERELFLSPWQPATRIIAFSGIRLLFSFKILPWTRSSEIRFDSTAASRYFLIEGPLIMIFLLKVSQSSKIFFTR